MLIKNGFKTFFEAIRNLIKNSNKKVQILIKEHFWKKKKINRITQFKKNLPYTKKKSLLE